MAEFAIIQVRNVNTFPKEKTPEAVVGTCWLHYVILDLDDQAALVVAQESSILAAARQARLEIEAEGVPHVDSCLNSTGLRGRTSTTAPSSHRLSSPIDYCC